MNIEDMKVLKRNVAQVGDRLMVALDKDWCREKGIGKGDELDIVVVNSGFLVLRPGHSEKEEVQPWHS